MGEKREKIQKGAAKENKETATWNNAGQDWNTLGLKDKW